MSSSESTCFPAGFGGPLSEDAAINATKKYSTRHRKSSEDMDPNQRTVVPLRRAECAQGSLELMTPSPGKQMTHNSGWRSKCLVTPTRGGNNTTGPHCTVIGLVLVWSPERRQKLVQVSPKDGGHDTMPQKSGPEIDPENATEKVKPNSWASLFASRFPGPFPDPKI